MTDLDAGTDDQNPRLEKQALAKALHCVIEKCEAIEERLGTIEDSLDSIRAILEQGPK